MTTNSLTDKQTLKTKIRAAAGRCATIGALASVALLCAPFVNPPRQEPVATPAMPEPANPQSRIGVKLRTGDTLGVGVKTFWRRAAFGVRDDRQGPTVRRSEEVPSRR